MFIYINDLRSEANPYVLNIKQSLPTSKIIPTTHAHLGSISAFIYQGRVIPSPPIYETNLTQNSLLSAISPLLSIVLDLTFKLIRVSLSNKVRGICMPKAESIQPGMEIQGRQRAIREIPHVSDLEQKLFIT